MLKAGLFGLLAGSALFFGALIGLYAVVSKKAVAAVMAFGSGVLISALSIDLMEEAYVKGGFDSVSIGFIMGALIFVVGDYFIDKHGGHGRKRVHATRHKETSRPEIEDSGSAIFLGALLDGIPESAAIGIGLLAGSGVGTMMLVAVFLSNFPEGMSGAMGMKEAGRSKVYILGLWGGVILVSGIASFLGYTFLGQTPPDVVAATMALAAGAILAMLADTMMPEAFDEGGRFIALVTVAGFLTAFVVSRLTS